MKLKAVQWYETKFDARNRRTMKITRIAQTLNELRVIPRMLMAFYIWLVYSTSQWFFALSDPSTAQAGFASAVVGAGAAWFGLYVNSGPNHVSRKENLTTGEE